MKYVKSKDLDVDWRTNSPSKGLVRSGPDGDYRRHTLSGSNCWSFAVAGRRHLAQKKVMRELNRITATARGKTWLRRSPVSSIHPGARGGYGALVPSLSRIRMGLAVSVLCMMGSVACKSKDSAPPSPDQSWSPPDLPAHQAGLQNHRIELPSNIVIDPRKIYRLPDLIDIAQDSIPKRRLPGRERNKHSQQSD